MNGWICMEWQWFGVDFGQLFLSLFALLAMMVMMMNWWNSIKVIWRIFLFKVRLFFFLLKK